MDNIKNSTNLNGKPHKKPSYRPLFFTLLISVLALVFVIFLNMDSAQKTVPKIKLSYFKNSQEVSDSIINRLQQEVQKQNQVWMGLEPDNAHQFEVIMALKNDLEKINGTFTQVVIDKELELSQEQRKQLGETQNISVKVDWEKLSEQISAWLKDPQQRVLFITPAIYSTNLILENSVSKIKKQIQNYNPLTFSVGYFSFDLEDEKKSAFNCKTEDHSGVSPWGCAVINKSRTQQRRLDRKKLETDASLIAGLMDLTGQNDYMVLVH